ncbi:hypothetical protein ACFL4C_01425 [Candidatus Omnitrophota bacterium]
MSRKKQKAPPFVMLRRDLLKDPAWRKLSSSAKVLYIYLRTKFNYKTFNEVTLAYSEVKGMMSSKTVSNAFKELQDKKFIEKTKHGGLFGGVCVYKFIGQYKEFYLKGHAI